MNAKTAAPAAGAPPAAPVAPAGAGAAPVKPVPVAPAAGAAGGAQPPPQQPDVGPKLARATAREQAARQAQAEFQAKEKAFEEHRKALEADAAEAKRLRALKTNPVALAKELGITPKQFLELAAQGDATDPAVVALIEEQKAKTAELEKQVKAQQEAAKQAGQQQVRAAFTGRIQALMEKGGERWEFARADGMTPAYVLEAAAERARLLRAEGVVVPDGDEDKLFEEIMDKAEAWAEKQAEERRKGAKYQKKFGAPAAAAAPEKGKKPAATTLTNDADGITPPAGGRRKWDPKHHLATVKARHPEFFDDDGKGKKPASEGA